MPRLRKMCHQLPQIQLTVPEPGVVCTSVILALGRLRQGDGKFQIQPGQPGNLARPCLKIKKERAGTQSLCAEHLWGCCLCAEEPEDCVLGPSSFSGLYFVQLCSCHKWL